jgi:hypothetical protein
MLQNTVEERDMGERGSKVESKCWLLEMDCLQRCLLATSNIAKQIMPFGGGGQRTPRPRAPLTRSRPLFSGSRPLTVVGLPHSAVPCSVLRPFLASIIGELMLCRAWAIFLGDLRSAQRTAGTRYLRF